MRPRVCPRPPLLGEEKEREKRKKKTQNVKNEVENIKGWEQKDGGRGRNGNRNMRKAENERKRTRLAMQKQIDKRQKKMLEKTTTTER